MYTDSFHPRAAQETLKKRLEDFQDFFDIVDTCRQSVVMNYHNFFKIHCSVSQAKYTASKPKLEDIQSVKFDKGSERMFWKASYTQEKFYSAQFLQRKLIKSLGNDFQQIEKFLRCKYLEKRRQYNYALSSPQRIATTILAKSSDQRRSSRLDSES